MPKSLPSAHMSEQNHTLLVKLADRVDNVGTTLKSFIDAQSEENRRIHERIDDAQERTAKAVESIKDSMASRGRVSGGFILSLCATLVSTLAILGGLATTYVNNRLETIQPTLTRHAAEIDAQRHAMEQERRQASEIQSQLAAHRAAQESDRAWIMRELDFTRDKFHKANLTQIPNPHQ